MEEGYIVKRVSVPMHLEELMNGLTKEILKNQPKDVILFASEYFSKLLKLRDEGYTGFARTRTKSSAIKLTPRKEQQTGKNVTKPLEKSTTNARTEQLARQVSLHVTNVDLVSKKIDHHGLVDNYIKRKRENETKKKAIFDKSKKNNSLSNNENVQGVKKNISSKPSSNKTKTITKRNVSKSERTDSEPKAESEVYHEMSNKFIPKNSSIEEEGTFVKGGLLAVVAPKPRKKSDSLVEATSISIPVPAVVQKNKKSDEKLDEDSKIEKGKGDKEIFFDKNKTNSIKDFDNLKEENFETKNIETIIEASNLVSEKENIKNQNANEDDEGGKSKRIDVSDSNKNEVEIGLGKNEDKLLKDNEHKMNSQQSGDIKIEHKEKDDGKSLEAHFTSKEEAEEKNENLHEINIESKKTSSLSVDKSEIIEGIDHTENVGIKIEEEVKENTKKEESGDQKTKLVETFYRLMDVEDKSVKDQEHNVNIDENEKLKTELKVKDERNNKEIQDTEKIKNEYHDQTLEDGEYKKEIKDNEKIQTDHKNVEDKKLKDDGHKRDVQNLGETKIEFSKEEDLKLKDDDHKKEIRYNEKIKNEPKKHEDGKLKDNDYKRDIKDKGEPKTDDNQISKDDDNSKKTEDEKLNDDNHKKEVANGKYEDQKLKETQYDENITIEHKNHEDQKLKDDEHKHDVEEQGEFKAEHGKDGSQTLKDDDNSKVNEDEKLNDDRHKKEVQSFGVIKTELVKNKDQILKDNDHKKEFLNIEEVKIENKKDGNEELQNKGNKLNVKDSGEIKTEHEKGEDQKLNDGNHNRDNDEELKDDGHKKDNQDNGEIKTEHEKGEDQKLNDGDHNKDNDEELKDDRHKKDNQDNGEIKTKHEKGKDQQLNDGDHSKNKDEELKDGERKIDNQDNGEIKTEHEKSEDQKSKDGGHNKDKDEELKDDGHKKYNQDIEEIKAEHGKGEDQKLKEGDHKKEKGEELKDDEHKKDNQDNGEIKTEHEKGEDQKLNDGDHSNDNQDNREIKTEHEKSEDQNSKDGVSNKHKDEALKDDEHKQDNQDNAEINAEHEKGEDQKLEAGDHHNDKDEKLKDDERKKDNQDNGEIKTKHEKGEDQKLNDGDNSKNKDEELKDDRHKKDNQDNGEIKTEHEKGEDQRSKDGDHKKEKGEELKDDEHKRDNQDKGGFLKSEHGKLEYQKLENSDFKKDEDGIKKVDKDEKIFKGTNLMGGSGMLLEKGFYAVKDNQHDLDSRHTENNQINLGKDKKEDYESKENAQKQVKNDHTNDEENKNLNERTIELTEVSKLHLEKEQEGKILQESKLNMEDEKIMAELKEDKTNNENIAVKEITSVTETTNPDLKDQDNPHDLLIHQEKIVTGSKNIDHQIEGQKELEITVEHTADSLPAELQQNDKTEEAFSEKSQELGKGESKNDEIMKEKVTEGTEADVKEIKKIDTDTPKGNDLDISDNFKSNFVVAEKPKQMPETKEKVNVVFENNDKLMNNKDTEIRAYSDDIAKENVDGNTPIDVQSNNTDTEDLIRKESVLSLSNKPEGEKSHHLDENLGNFEDHHEDTVNTKEKVDNDSNIETADIKDTEQQHDKDIVTFEKKEADDVSKTDEMENQPEKDKESNLVNNSGQGEELNIAQDNNKQLIRMKTVEEIPCEKVIVTPLIDHKDERHFELQTEHLANEKISQTDVETALKENEKQLEISSSGVEITPKDEKTMEKGKKSLLPIHEGKEEINGDRQTITVSELHTSGDASNISSKNTTVHNIVTTRPAASDIAGNLIPNENKRSSGFDKHEDITANNQLQTSDSNLTCSNSNLENDLAEEHLATMKNILLEINLEENENKNTDQINSEEPYISEEEIKSTTDMFLRFEQGFIDKHADDTVVPQTKKSADVAHATEENEEGTEKTINENIEKVDLEKQQSANDHAKVLSKNEGKSLEESKFSSKENVNSSQEALKPESDAADTIDPTNNDKKDIIDKDQSDSQKEENVMVIQEAPVALKQQTEEEIQKIDVTIVEAEIKPIKDDTKETEKEVNEENYTALEKLPSEIHYKTSADMSNRKQTVINEEIKEGEANGKKEERKLTPEVANEDSKKQSEDNESKGKLIVEKELDSSSLVANTDSEMKFTDKNEDEKSQKKKITNLETQKLNEEQTENKNLEKETTAGTDIKKKIEGTVESIEELLNTFDKNNDEKGAISSFVEGEKHEILFENKLKSESEITTTIPTAEENSITEVYGKLQEPSVIKHIINDIKADTQSVKEGTNIVKNDGENLTTKLETSLKNVRENIANDAKSEGEQNAILRNTNILNEHQIKDKEELEKMANSDGGREKREVSNVEKKEIITEESNHDGSKLNLMSQIEKIESQKSNISQVNKEATVADHVSISLKDDSQNVAEKMASAVELSKQLLRQLELSESLETTKEDTTKGVVINSTKDVTDLKSQNKENAAIPKKTLEEGEKGVKSVQKNSQNDGDVKNKREDPEHDSSTSKKDKNVKQESQKTSKDAAEQNKSLIIKPVEIIEKNKMKKTRSVSITRENKKKDGSLKTSDKKPIVKSFSSSYTKEKKASNIDKKHVSKSSDVPSEDSGNQKQENGKSQNRRTSLGSSTKKLSPKVKDEVSSKSKTDSIAISEEVVGKATSLPETSKSILLPENKIPDEYVKDILLANGHDTLEEEKNKEKSSFTIDDIDLKDFLEKERLFWMATGSGKMEMKLEGENKLHEKLPTTEKQPDENNLSHTNILEQKEIESPHVLSSDQSTSDQVSSELLSSRINDEQNYQTEDNENQSKDVKSDVIYDGRLSSASSDGSNSISIQTEQLNASSFPISAPLNQDPAGAARVTSETTPTDVGDVVGVGTGVAEPTQTQNREGRARGSATGSSTVAQQDMDANSKSRRNNSSIARQENKNMEEVAATKIQASFRGYQVRKQLKTKNGGTEAISQGRVGRRKNSGKLRSSDVSAVSKNSPPKKNADIEERSATKIQAGVRGFLVRRRFKKDKTNTTPGSS